MATNPKTQNAGTPTVSRGRGRPPKDSPDAVDPITKAKGNLQYAFDRAVGFINDNGPSSMAGRIAQAAKRGIPRATVEPLLRAVEDALEDCRAAMDRAYAPVPEQKAATRRVNLLD